MEISQLIKVATGSDDIQIGDNLASCTRQIQAIRCHNPLQNCDVLFVDTPGFDDTVRSDMDILQGLADWLEKTLVFSLIRWKMADKDVIAIVAESNFLASYISIESLIIE
jgi:hypothetical protein